MKEYVKYEKEPWGALLTIDRPEALNALNGEVYRQLEAELVKCEVEKAKVVVITGSGKKSFVAGADIAQMKDMTPAQAKDFSRLGQIVISKIAQMDAIVIAAINGFALGGGLELAMGCDFRIASENARLGLPEVTLGVIPGSGGTQRLARLVGRGKAMEMLTTGCHITAKEAAAIGLVNEVTEQDALLETVFAKAAIIAGNGSGAVAAAKRSLIEGIEMDLERGLMFEAHMFALTFTDPDQREGMTAFLEKRKANFR